MEEFKMGNVNDGTDISMPICEMFMKQNIYNNPTAKNAG